MKQTTTQQVNHPASMFSELRGFLMWPEVQLLAGLLLFLFVARLLRKTDKLADARWADKAAIRHARRKALRQIKKPILGKGVALYLGDPKIYPVPDVHQHIAVVGVTGCGKTSSVIDQLIRSALEQKFTSFVYDVKAEQLRKHAAYSLSLGFHIHCFAPGMPWSGCINPLVFLRDEFDSTSARQIAITINRNMLASTKKDDFFGPAADSLLETVLLMAKGSCYPDFLMAWELLRLPNLAQRLKHAKGLDLWAEVAATTTISVAEAERTVAGIVGGAVNAFRAFVSKDLLPSIFGETTIPLRMDGKHLVFFQVDEERLGVTGPLCALMYRMLLIANLNNQFKRTTPLCAFMDEATSSYFPGIDDDLNLRRSYGLIAVLGYQGRSQLVDQYGAEKARNIETGTVTKFNFKTTDPDYQKELTAALGNKEVKIESRSYSSSNNSRSETIHQVPLLPSNQWEQLDLGEAILRNPGVKSRGRSSLPWHISPIKIAPEIEELEKRSLKRFQETIGPRMIHNAQTTGLRLDDRALEMEMLDRRAYADMLLPEIDEIKAAKAAEAEAAQKKPTADVVQLHVTRGQNYA